MSDEFIQPIGSDNQGDQGAQSDDSANRASRRSVRVFLLGRGDDVEMTILELHTRHFGEAGLWSQPLQFPETRNQFVLSPGEVMRVYKRYLT